MSPPDDAQALRFKTLIEAVLSHSILSLPRLGMPYSVDTGACDHQLGATLFQTQPDRELKPFGFWSHTFLLVEKKYSISEKECLAIVWAFRTLCAYLQGELFILHSDQAALRWLLGITELLKDSYIGDYGSAYFHSKWCAKVESQNSRRLALPAHCLRTHNSAA